MPLPLFPRAPGHATPSRRNNFKRTMQTELRDRNPHFARGISFQHVHVVIDRDFHLKLLTPGATSKLHVWLHIFWAIQKKHPATKPIWRGDIQFTHIIQWDVDKLGFRIVHVPHWLVSKNRAPWAILHAQKKSVRIENELKFTHPLLVVPNYNIQWDWKSQQKFGLAANDLGTNLRVLSSNHNKTSNSNPRSRYV